MKTSIQIGTVMGIPIKIHISFLLVLTLFPILFAMENVDNVFGFAYVASTPLRYALSMVLTILLFTCVLLHELGHSWVAKRYGIVIRSITLMILGGIAAMDNIPRDPRAEMRISIAGPAVSLGIAVFCSIIYLGIHNITQTPALSHITHLVWSLACINITLFTFNLIPAFPMDGGRVLRAWLAGHTPYLRATRKAVYIGKMIAIVMGVFGLLVRSPFLVLITFFVYIGASEEERFTKVSVMLDGIKVRDIMTRNIAQVPENMTISEVLRLMFVEKHVGYPVIDQFTRNVVGIVTFADIKNVPMSEHETVLVRDVMTTDLIFVSEAADAVDALKTMSAQKIGRLLVRDGGAIAGIVSRTDLMRSIEVLGYGDRYR